MQTQCEPKIEITQDGLSATLSVPEDFDRATLTPELCNAMLTRGSIDLTCSHPELAESFIAKAQAAPPGVFKGVLAQGTPVEHGSDATIEWARDESEQDESDGPDASTDVDVDDEEAPVCFYSRATFTVVHPGDVLGQVYPETTGKEGVSVTGEAIPAKPGKPLDFKYDESITIDSQNQLIAKAQGVLIRSGKTALISDTIEVEENVDFNTGNIDFNGNIVVRQGVKDCFIVKATEDIEVRGLIEAATLIAGGDLRSSGGFAGREQGTAKVGGNLYAKYLDAVKVNVRGDLCVDREIINCQITVLGNIDSPRGAIIGGQTKVSGTVEVMDIGASAHPQTTVYIGLLPHLDPHIEQLATLTSSLIQERQRLLDEQEHITSNSGTNRGPTNQSQLCSLMRQLAEVQQHLDRAEPALQRIQVRAEVLRKIDVTIKRKLHPNALLVYGDFYYRIRDEIKGPVRITANKRGQLQYQRNDEAPVLLSTEADLQDAA